MCFILVLRKLEGESPHFNKNGTFGGNSPPPHSESCRISLYCCAKGSTLMLTGWTAGQKLSPPISTDKKKD